MPLVQMAAREDMLWLHLLGMPWIQDFAPGISTPKMCELSKLRKVQFLPEQYLAPYPITLYIEELLFIVFWPRKLGNGGIDPVDLL